ncbi:MAG TPA: type II secretion system F family protein [Xanthobacteraceae bacterium]|nr:type II secretion system F family protein [Xanthobacteraceae bacterium]
MTMQPLALFFLVSVAIGGVIWVFVYPIISGERRVEQRRESVARTAPVRRLEQRAGGKPRRDQIEETLKEVEARHKASKRVPLATRISQAGLTWSKQRFFLTAGALGIAGFLLFMLTGVGVIPSLGVGFAAGFGLPFWVLSYLKKRREAKFLDVFPDAVDIIVRGIKSGLPLMDCLKVIVAEAPEPVRSEIRTIVESQAIGLPMGEACLKLYERMPIPEANFFGIVIFIQQKSGGNLSEALGNLSRVLRDRKRMKAKIQSMSMEAKASGAIIASLPIVVMILVYLTSPDYISLLWTQQLGKIMLAASAFWMSIGVLVMRKMINFDF